MLESMPIEDYILGKTYISILEAIRPKTTSLIEMILSVPNDLFYCQNTEYNLFVNYTKIISTDYTIMVNLYLPTEHIDLPSQSLPYVVICGIVNDKIIPCGNYLKYGSIIYFIFQELVKHFKLDLNDIN
jgi:hypothetical protein